MAPAQIVRDGSLTDRPLVDHFWIAGLDGQELLEAYRSQTSTLEPSRTYESPKDRNSNVFAPEDVLAEEDESSSGIGSAISNQSGSRPDSYQRLSKLSNEARRSIQSIDTIVRLRSNRSSATIKPSPSPTSHPPAWRGSRVLNDVDFDRALQSFASDRDTFLLNLDFRNGNDSVVASPAKLKPKPQRIVPEDLDTTLNRSMGSVRRHMSFRDMNSTKRQPSTAAKRYSTRSSRRISTYNSVIPQPEDLRSNPNEHPLRHHFEPVLLDQFPRPNMVDEMKRRDPLPDYIPMFAFPNDIQIISSDARPPTTWHEFSMTAADNSKIPAVCVIIWIPMNRQTADELERLCEQWRRANLTDAEREMAASLGERLVVERAKLSKFLSQLPQHTQGSLEREQLEDEISSVEEKINLMSDMLRPLRHGAASRIEGLADSDTGLWIPRAYGILGRDQSLASVWKEWLKSVVVPMMDSSILRVPPSSPKVGMWQPLERYVFNVCCEVQAPSSSNVQVELSVRELRLYAKKEAVNELPGSRTTDLYPLFRALTIPNILVLFEYLLSEARIILVSNHPAMLKLASKALLQILWPFEWAGVYIPVLPARLMQVLDAPCPYLCGVVRKNDKLSLPEEDFVLVDLDKNEIHATEQPLPIPRPQRRKLMSLLHLAAPHHHSRGVPVRPPASAIQAFPNSAYSAEQASIFSPTAISTNLSKFASMSSSMFGAQAAAEQIKKQPILNAFLHFTTATKNFDRLTTSSMARQPSQTDSDSASPLTANFPPLPQTPVSRHDSGYALQTSLKEKRSGYMDSFRLGDNFSSVRRKASLPFVRHTSNPSVLSASPVSEGGSVYAPSSYAQSTLATSTVMPGIFIQPARNTETQMWIEGHCLLWQSSATRMLCSVCDEKLEGNHYACSDCALVTHAQCTNQVTTVCQAAFYPDQIRAAFARFFASLLYSYKKFASPVDLSQRTAGISSKINVDAWTRSLTPEHASYIEMLKQTQAFNEFIAEREYTSTSVSNSVKLFDGVIAAKRSRSGRIRPSMASIGLGRYPFLTSTSGGSMNFLMDTSSHIWRLVSFAMPSARPDLSKAANGRDYRTIITRTPAKLEDVFWEKPSTAELNQAGAGTKVRSLKQRMNGLSMNAP